MKRLLFLAFIFCFVSTVHAEEIENLRITAGDKIAIIEWDQLPEEVTYNINGYAVQWNEAVSKMRNVDAMKQYVSSRNDSLTLRLEPFREKTYFFRVYTYMQSGREYEYGSSSKILKVVFNYLGEVTETSQVEPQDPVISENENVPGFEFGKLRISNELPTSVDFYWSAPNLSKSDYEGFKILVSKNEDMSDPVVSNTVGRDITDVQITDLSPSTTYYAQAFFYKTQAGAKQKVGKESIKESFTTSSAFTSAQESRYKRLLQQRIITHPVVKISTGDETSSTESTSTEEETTTTSTTTTSTSSSTTSSTSSSSGYSRAEIEAKIKQLKQDLTIWENRLKSLSTSSSSSSSTSASSSSSSRSSALLTRLKAILDARRAAKK